MGVSSTLPPTLPLTLPPRPTPQDPPLRTIGVSTGRNVRVTVGVSVGVGVGGSVENEILQCLSGFQKILGWVSRKKDNNVEELPDRGRRTGSSKGSNRKHVT